MASSSGLFSWLLQEIFEKGKPFIPTSNSNYKYTRRKGRQGWRGRGGRREEDDCPGLCRVVINR